MSSRFILPFADVGSGIKPSSGAQLFFFATGGSTPKDTFSDQLSTPTPNANPVIANAVGVFSDIFITGTYKVVLKDKDGVQKWEADPVIEAVTASSVDQQIINDLSQAVERATVDAMTSSTVVLPIGKTIHTQGYYDGWAALAKPQGNAEYLTVTLQSVRDTLSDPTWVPNEFSDHTLDNGDIAKLQNNGTAIDLQYGLKGDGVFDSHPRMQAMFDDEFNVQFTEGDFLITQGINVRGATTIRCDALARVTAGANDIIMFIAHQAPPNGSIHTYDLILSGRTAANVFHTGVTGFSITSAGYNTAFHGLRCGQMLKGLHLKSDIFGIAVTDMQCQKVEIPIELGDSTGGVAGTIMIDNPIFDNSVFAAGDNLGTGVLFNDNCSATVNGGYIQGFVNGIDCSGPGITLTAETVYFENTTNAGINLNGNRYANIVRCHYLGFNGAVFVKGRSANNVRITDPTMSTFNATIGLYDFDDDCDNCSYKHIVSADTNTKLGITTGIKPIDATGMFSSKDSFAQTGVIDTESEMFTITLPQNSVTEITVKHRAVENTAYFGTVQKEWKILASRGSGVAMISAISESADQALSNSNINYGLDNSISITEPTSGVLAIGVTTTSTSGIDVVSIEERAELNTVTTKDVVLTNKIP